MAAQDVTALVGETDARVWARRFLEAVGWQPWIVRDLDTMTAWFAVAIEAGRDAGQTASTEWPDLPPAE